MKIQPVITEKVPNEQCRIFHARMPLGDCGYWCRGWLHTDTPGIIDLIFEIPGVETAAIREGTYSLHVTKGITFTWEEIEPKLLKLLEGTQQGMEG